MLSLTLTLDDNYAISYDNEEGPMTYDVGFVWVIVNHANGTDHYAARAVKSVELLRIDDDE